MRSYHVYIHWDTDVQAEDEFDALLQAESKLDFIGTAFAVERDEDTPRQKTLGNRDK